MFLFKCKKLIKLTSAINLCINNDSIEIIIVVVVIIIIKIKLLE